MVASSQAPGPWYYYPLWVLLDQMYTRFSIDTGFQFISGKCNDAVKSIIVHGIMYYSYITCLILP